MPSWLFTKSHSFPVNGKLQLGQILSDAANPSFVLQPAGVFPIPPELLEPSTFKEGVVLDSSSELSVQFSSWLRATGIPVAASADVSSMHAGETRWRFDRLESRTMAPSLAYARGAMSHGDVPENLKKWSFKPRMYMVTGIRTAHGAQLTKREERSRQAGFGVEGDSGALGAPISGGVRGQVGQSGSETQAFESSSDFVFAYRLHEVHYRGKVSLKPFVRGETSSTGVKRPTEGSYVDIEVVNVSEKVVLSKSDFREVAVDGYEGVLCSTIADPD
ncbi:hypothetical protein GQ53DRAFT_746543 [Thozetella sp. PMI_491]|nr:hypothetical protein GQ53DRAFT_746543 [Thozetella sp. PMI_491]